MNRKAVFPGSFDPFTIGHESIVKRTLPLFDEITVAIGHNSSKKSLFTLDERVKIVKKVFEDEPKVNVIVYEGLTIDMCIREKSKFILRGLRTSSDFEYERAIAQTNRSMYPEIETMFILTQPEHTHVNSNIVRDILIHGGNANMFFPVKAREIINSKKF